MREWKGELDDDKETKQLKEFSKRSDSTTTDTSHKALIAGIIADGLGPLGKYTRGGRE